MKIFKKRSGCCQVKIEEIKEDPKANPQVEQNKKVLPFLFTRIYCAVN